MKASTRQKWEGRWDQLAGKVKSLWGDITDDDLLKVKGDYQRLVGLLKERSGKTEEQIEEMLEK